MFHVHIDTVDTRNVVGFECGTRGRFDQNHGGDPLWVFVDSTIQNRIHLSLFLINPTSFYFDSTGILQQGHAAAPPPP